MRSVLVAFWSPFHGQTATTSNSVCIGTFTAITRSLKVLLMHNKMVKSNMENAFLDYYENETKGFDDSGIDSLVKLAVTGRLSSELFNDYTKTLLRDRLELLTGTFRKRESDSQRLMETIQYVILCAKKSYNMVICDVNASWGESSLKVLELADIVVVNLNQNIEVLYTYFKRKEWNDVLNKKPHIILLGNYQHESKYSIKHIKKVFNYGEEIFKIPVNVNFMDAYNDHDVLNFFLSNYKTEKNDLNHTFMTDINLVCTKILELSGIDMESTYNPIESQTIFDIALKLLGAKK